MSLAVSQRGGARTATKSSSFSLITIVEAANVLSGISVRLFVSFQRDSTHTARHNGYFRTVSDSLADVSDHAGPFRAQFAELRCGSFN